MKKVFFKQLGDDNRLKNTQHANGKVDKGTDVISDICPPRIPNDPMLNFWLNIKDNCSRKRIKNQGMPCNSLCIPTTVV